MHRMETRDSQAVQNRTYHFGNFFEMMILFIIQSVNKITTRLHFPSLFKFIFSFKKDDTCIYV